MSLRRATGLLAVAILVAAAPAAASQGNGRIAYISGGAIYTVDPTGGAPTLLHDGYYPSFSSDGTRIVFAQYSADAGPFQIWVTAVAVVRADGSGRTLLIQDATKDVAPSWSPDGSHIAFFRGNFGQPTARTPSKSAEPSTSTPSPGLRTAPE